MTSTTVPMAKTALLLADLQNDFIEAKGAYGRAGQSAPEIVALPQKVRPLAEAMRAAGGLVIAKPYFPLRFSFASVSMIASISPISSGAAGKARFIAAFPAM